MAKKAPSFQPVALLWTDAAFDAIQDEYLLPIPAITFGIVWEETEEYIKIASEIFADGVGRSFCVVPKGPMGPRIVKLNKFLCPDDFLVYQSTLFT